MKRIALALGIVLVVAACGGDSEENDASDQITIIKALIAEMQAELAK